MTKMTSGHVPVLLNEVLFYLNPGPNDDFIDCTLGGGGHAQAILEKTGPMGKLLGIDLDEKTLAETKIKLKKYGSRLVTANGNFANLETFAQENGFTEVKGILIDLGISSIQLAGEGGFSFNSDERLDMRFGQQGPIDAYKIVNLWPEEDIIRILKEFGEEKFAKGIAKKIVDQRKVAPIEKASQLAELIKLSIPRRSWPAKIHPATKSFQALRMAVNSELGNLEAVMPRAIKLLAKGGRLGIISFHSLEDRMVKQFFKQESKDCVCPPEFPTCICRHPAKVKLLTTKAIPATEEEIKINPRSRSAKLRVVEKI